MKCRRRVGVREFTDAWGGKYPAIIRLWDNAWAEFVPFLAFDVEIRTVVCSTNASRSTPGSAERSAPAATSPTVLSGPGPVPTE